MLAATMRLAMKTMSPLHSRLLAFSGLSTCATSRDSTSVRTVPLKYFSQPTDTLGHLHTTGTRCVPRGIRISNV
ncbi:hypothetical protein MRX96_017117 [Rhipicephalus microplus]